MAKITLITGGCRSGKSRHAQQLAESLPGRCAYLAACPDVDEEMRGRIARHRRERSAGGWVTIEEATDLAGAIIAASEFDTVLVDCLTLWVSNIDHAASRDGSQIGEDEIASQCESILAACRDHPGRIFIVTNEVGLGIVPDNSIARRFRDLLGRCNQTIAAGADVVTLVCCGIPLQLKGGG